MLQKLIDIAKGAGEIVMKHYGSRDLQVEWKEVESRGGFNRQDLVTIADKESDAYIRKKVLELPHVKVVTEECTQVPKDYSGLVVFGDPIDSTSSFKKGKDSFSIILGAAINGVPTFGVVYIPARETIYFAEKGQGAYLQFLKANNKPTIIRTCEVISRLETSCLVRDDDMGGKKKKFSEVIEGLTHRSIHEDGSAGIRICAVAQGSGDTYLHPSDTISQWDTAGPQVVLEEAGGKISNAFGEPLIYAPNNLQHSNGVLASNGVLHPDLVREVKELCARFNINKV